MPGFNFQMPQDPTSTDLPVDPQQEMLLKILQGSSMPSGGTAPMGTAIPSPSAFADIVQGQQAGTPQNAGASDVDLPAMQAPAQAQAPSPSPDLGANPTPSQAVTATPQGQITPDYNTPQLAAKAGAASGQGGIGSIFSDPMALLTIAQVLGNSPNYGESGIGQIARALATGNAYVQAKNYSAQEQVRQQNLDAQKAQLDQSEIASRTASTAATEQATSEAVANQGLKRDAITKQLAAADQALANAKTDQERTQLQNKRDNLELSLRTKYGDQQVQSALDAQSAQTGSAKASTALNEIQGKVAQDKFDLIKQLPVDDQTRIAAGMGSQSLKTYDDKFLDWLKTNQKAYTQLDQNFQPSGIDTAKATADFAKLYGDRPGTEPGSLAANQPGAGVKANTPAPKLTPQQWDAYTARAKARGIPLETINKIRSDAGMPPTQ